MRNYFLTIIFACVFTVSFLSITYADKDGEQPESINEIGSGVVLKTYNVTKSENKVIELVNLERKKHNLAPLKLDIEVCKVARKKARDMKERNYFSHQSPTYGSPWDMLKHFSVSYKAAAENIAAGSPTSKEVMKQWMNSPDHRDNILNPSFTHMGVGFTKGGSYGIYWTQIFIRGSKEDNDSLPIGNLEDLQKDEENQCDEKPKSLCDMVQKLITSFNQFEGTVKTSFNEMDERLGNLEQQVLEVKQDVTHLKTIVGSFEQ